MLCYFWATVVITYASDHITMQIWGHIAGLWFWKISETIFMNRWVLWCFITNPLPQMSGIVSLHCRFYQPSSVRICGDPKSNLQHAAVLYFTATDTQQAPCQTLTLRAQLTRSSSFVTTYSALLLATAAGLAAATAVLLSLMGTTLKRQRRRSFYTRFNTTWPGVCDVGLSDDLTLCWRRSYHL